MTKNQPVFVGRRQRLGRRCVTAAVGGSATARRVGGRAGPAGTGFTAAMGLPSRNRSRSARMAAPSA